MAGILTSFQTKPLNNVTISYDFDFDNNNDHDDNPSPSDVVVGVLPALVDTAAAPAAASAESWHAASVHY